jgi:hypothetical protein
MKANRRHGSSTVSLPLALRNASRTFEAIAEGRDEHPVDAAVTSVPTVARLARRLKRASARLAADVRDRRRFIDEQDSQTAYRTAREEHYFAAGYWFGVVAARFEPRLPTRQALAVARQIGRTTLLAKLQPTEAAVALLETVRALILPVRRRRLAG